jgi:hypothetical protein
VRYRVPQAPDRRRKDQERRGSHPRSQQGVIKPNIKNPPEWAGVVKRLF